MKSKRTLDDLDEVTNLMKSSFTFVKNPTTCPIKRRQIAMEEINTPVKLKRTCPEEHDQLLDRVKNIAKAMTLKRMKRGTRNPFLDPPEVADSEIEMSEANDMITIRLNPSLFGNMKLSKNMVKSLNHQRGDYVVSPRVDSDLLSIVLPRSTLEAMITDFENHLKASANQPKIEEIDSDDDIDVSMNDNDFSVDCC
eukprot:TRINITY_DN1773_c3_g1_i1.p1 TRINITY_DN1773_c3_g1~~TRINITY_DN1773_c3_g1_i1.p1  ORF type:complete len:224 (+),score=39.04 TRINITY_DN1773_c3_g1_i1:87-674(+)